MSKTKTNSGKKMRAKIASIGDVAADEDALVARVIESLGLLNAAYRRSDEAADTTHDDTEVRAATGSIPSTSD